MNKKILFVITGLGMGGAERQVVDLADSFNKKNYDVTIAYILEPVVVKPKSANIKLISLNGSKSIFGILKAIKNLINTIKTTKPDIVHSHMYHANIITRIAKIFVNVPKLVCTAHSKNEGGKIRMFLYRITNFLGDSFTNVSQEAVEAFEQKGASKRNQMIAMHNGIDCNIFTFDINERERLREKYNLNNKRVFIHIGRFTEAKNHINLLIAYKNILEKFSDINLVLVGDGELRTQIEDFILNNNLSQNVSLLGIQKNISSLLSMSDIFVLSSSWEGLPLVIGEAMSCERIVVSTDCGGVSEVLGDCGFLVEPKNNQVLTEAMKKAYYLNEQEAKNIGKIARKRVLDKYSLDSVVREWENIYK
jgi:glycosyltransferase involved in cell wall biosynthesis